MNINLASNTFSKIVLISIFIVKTVAPVFSQIFTEAENYSSMIGVNTEGTSDEGGGLNVGWIDNNDWMEYLVEIPIQGDYLIRLRTARENPNVIAINESETELTSIDFNSFS